MLRSSHRIVLSLFCPIPVPQSLTSLCWLHSCHSLRWGDSLGQRWFVLFVCPVSIRVLDREELSGCPGRGGMDECEVELERKVNRKWMQCKQKRCLPSEQSLQSREEDSC